MPNLVAISQATTEINRGGGSECFKSPRSDRVKTTHMNLGTQLIRRLKMFWSILATPPANKIYGFKGCKQLQALKILLIMT